MIALIVIGIILLSLIILTLFSVRLYADYKNEFTLKIKYLFFSFSILPEKLEEEVSDTAEKAVEETDDKEGKTSVIGDIKNFFKHEGFSGIIDFIKKLISLIYSLTKSLLANIKIKKFDMYLSITGEDAAAAAIKYGEISLLASALYSALFSFKKCKNPRISTDLNYENNDGDSAVFSMMVSIRLIHLIVIGLSALIKGLPLFRRFKASSNKKQEVKKENAA